MSTAERGVFSFSYKRSNYMDAGGCGSEVGKILRMSFVDGSSLASKMVRVKN
jgi:hypothetical protein